MLTSLLFLVGAVGPRPCRQAGPRRL